MKLITLLYAISLLTACQGKPNHDFTISGKIKNGQGKIYLRKLDIALTVEGHDSLIRHESEFNADGSFSFQIKDSEENLYLLQWQTYNNIYLVNDNSHITIEEDKKGLNGFKITGSKASNESDSISYHIDYMKQYDLAQLYDSAEFLKEKNQLLTYFNKASCAATQFLAFTTILGLAEKHVQGIKSKYIEPMTPEEMKVLINNSLKKFPNNKYFTFFKERMEEYEKQKMTLKDKNSATQALPSFSLPNTEGKIVSIDAFKGQYVLLDFWASWCGPCRQENPYLVKAFNQFKNKNFTIVGVSLDEDKDAWLNAITKDNLTWTHLSDLKGWESQAAQLFHVNAIPFNLLVDPQGNIIASELRGEMLEQKLEEILK